MSKGNPIVYNPMYPKDDYHLANHGKTKCGIPYGEMDISWMEYIEKSLPGAKPCPECFPKDDPNQNELF